MCYAYTKRFRKRSIHNNIFHFYVIQYAYRSKTNINMYIMKSLHLYFWSFMLHSNIGFRAFCVYTMLGSDAINNIFQNWNTNKNYTFFVIFSLYHKYYIWKPFSAHSQEMTTTTTTTNRTPLVGLLKMDIICAAANKSV